MSSSRPAAVLTVPSSLCGPGCDRSWYCCSAAVASHTFQTFTVQVFENLRMLQGAPSVAMEQAACQPLPLSVSPLPTASAAWQKDIPPLDSHPTPTVSSHSVEESYRGRVVTHLILTLFCRAARRCPTCSSRTGAQMTTPTAEAAPQLLSTQPSSTTGHDQRNWRQAGRR